jgi:hypothetical protein
MVWSTAARRGAALTLEETEVAFGGGLESHSGESGCVHGGYVRGASRGGGRGPVDGKDGGTSRVWTRRRNRSHERSALTKNLSL